MATPGMKLDIEEALATKIKIFLDDIQVSRDKLVRIAKQVQVHTVEPDTAALLARIISGHSTSIDQLKSDLEQKLQHLGVEITKAAEDLTQSKNAIDAQRGELTKKENTLLDEKTKVDKLIKDYEQRVESVAAIQKSMDSSIDKLTAAQDGAITHELLVKDLHNAMDQANNNHQQTIQKLEQKYEAEVTRLEQENKKVEKELQKAQQQLDDTRTQSEKYKIDQATTSTRQLVRFEDMEQELKQIKQKMEDDAASNAANKARADRLEAENHALHDQLAALQSQHQDKRHGSGMTGRTAATGRKVGAIIQRGMDSVRQKTTRGRPSTPSGVPTTSPGDFSSNMSSNVASKVPSKTPSMFGPELGSTLPSTAASNLEGIFRPATSGIGLPDPDRGGVHSSFGDSTSTVRPRPTAILPSVSTTSLGKHVRAPGETPDVTKKTKIVDSAGVPGQTTLTLPRTRPHSAVPAVDDSILGRAPQDREDQRITSIASGRLMTAREFLVTENQRQQIGSQAQLEPDDMQSVTGGDDQEMRSPHDNQRGPSQPEPRVDPELTSNRDAVAERARRDGAAPPRQLPGQPIWQGPPIQDPNNPGNPTLIYEAVRKPANWDNRANDSLIDMLTSQRGFGQIAQDFHNSPACMATRMTRAKVIVEDDQKPCARCSKSNKVCFGLRVLDDTLPPKARYDGRNPRMDFERNANGHYWEAVYRPARGPGGDDDVGPSGNAPAV